MKTHASTETGYINETDYRAINETEYKAINETEISANNVTFPVGDNRELELKVLIVTIVLGSYMLLSVLGNSVVFYVYTMKIQTIAESRFLIPILAIIDLLACIANCSSYIAETIIGIGFDSDVGCKSMWFACISTTSASMLMLLVIAIDRYLFVCRPSGRQITTVWKRCIIAIITLSAVIIAAPSFVFFGLAPVKEGKLNAQGCRNISAGVPKVGLIYNILLFSLTIFNLLVLEFLHLVTYRASLRQSKSDAQYRRTESPAQTSSTWTGTVSFHNRADKNMRTSSKHERSEVRMVSFNTFGGEERKLSITKPKKPNEQDNRSLIQQQKKVKEKTIKKRYSSVISSLKSTQERTQVPSLRMTKMFTVITALFILSVLPKLVAAVLEFVNPEILDALDEPVRTGLFFVSTLYIVSFFFKPFIYGLMDRKFQYEIKKLCNVRKLIVTDL